MRYTELITALLLLSVIGCKSHSPRIDQGELYRHPGIQWLSWTPTERKNFVFGYTEGYGMGIYLACRSADHLFEKDQPHLIGHDNVLSTYPSARCRRSVEQYSNVKLSVSAAPDYSAYTDVITTFYRNYPEYRDIHYINLITSLAGAKLRSVDDLYSMAKQGKFFISRE